MPFLGPILTRIIELRQNLSRVKKLKTSYKVQRKTLKRILYKAEDTLFGKTFGFSSIYNSDEFLKLFQAKVPIYNYDLIFKEWWYKTLEGERDVCWPGKIKYFALSSGTSESSSKHIPVTKDMLRAIKRTSVQQLLSMAVFDIPINALEKNYLMIGGSTDLSSKGSYSEGDLSGITVKNIPFWFQQFYKPGKEIGMERDWEAKIQKIVDSAKDWDIGAIAGVPAWVQIIFDKVIKEYKLKSIHDIWPNLGLFVHGGVSIEPYRKSFEKYFSKKMVYIETYLASEGYIAYQSRPESSSMQLALRYIYYEFIPFNESNFDTEGNLIANPKVLNISEIEENIDYALLISTPAGAWRYLIGDTIRFTSKQRSEIIITGRTKHFLSLCGEHLSIENMNNAISHVANELGIDVKEYTVAGMKYNEVFAHKWYIGTSSIVNAEEFKEQLDKELCLLNDDYAVERKAALKEILIEIIPIEIFYEFMKYKGKQGGQNKFPRVMKSENFEEWESFVSSNLGITN
ncbi:MAG TPA: GH3 auxin-responsive promoter family protein [Saprospiraceae bacterium]|nr:GH3 auxin-responsive promoter family protein [Saprospiraceae bacterium]